MRILQVIPYFYLSWAGGGPVELVHNMSRGLIERGHEVTIYTTDVFNKPLGSGKLYDSTELDGIKVCEFRHLGGGLTRGLPFYFSPAIIPALAKETANFDIVHLHEYRTFQNVVAHHYAQKFRVPYVLQAHGSLPITLGKQLLKQIYDGFWGYALLKGAARLIAVSEMEAQQYEDAGMGRERIETIPNGLDLSPFQNLPSRGGFRRRHGLDDEGIVLYVGRLHQIKGLDLLARSFAELAQSTDNVRLVIVGPDAGYSSTLKKLVADLGISDRVLFTGPLYGQEKLEAYVDADVYVLPSYYEIFSMTLLEACACGTPVVVTDRCALADVVDGQAGLVTPCDEKRLAKEVSHILGDDSLSKQLGAGGRQLVQQRYGLAKMAERLESVYMQAARDSIRYQR